MAAREIDGIMRAMPKAAQHRAVRLARALPTALLLLVAGHGSAQAPDPSAGLLATCAACHGPEGVALEEQIPSLGGQNEAYLFEALSAFKAGQRPSATMRGITREMGEPEMRELARHFASRPYVRKPQAADGARAERGREVYLRLCQICHLDEGRDTTYADYPLLAGQSLPYMQNQMRLILDKRRSVEVAKQGMLDLLTRAQIDDAIHFFASRQASPDQVGGGLTTAAKRLRKSRFKSTPLPESDAVAE